MIRQASLVRAVGGLSLVALAGALAVTGADRTLYAPTFLSGWSLAAVAALPLVAWWSPPGELAAFGRRARRQLWVAALMLGLFLVHVELRLPLGWLETTLFALLVAFLASSCVGASLAIRELGARRGERLADLERGAARWLRVHVALASALFALGLFHGAFVHLHGWLAHRFLHAGG